MNIFKLVKKDFLIFIKVKSSIVLTFLVPMVLTFIFGAVFGGLGSKETKTKIAVLAVDNDNTPESRRLLQSLDKLETISIETEYTQNGRIHKLTPIIMDDRIKKGDYKVGLLIKRGFSGAIPGEKKPGLEIHADPKYTMEYNILKVILQKTFMREFFQVFFSDMFDQTQASEFVLGEFARAGEMGAMPGGDEKSGDIQDKLQKSMDIDVVELLGQKEEHPMFAQYVAGLAVLFLLFSVTHAGSTLLEEKNKGTINRLLVSPVKKSEILGAKLLYISLLGLAQIITLFIFGWLVFGLNIFKDIPALMVMMVMTALAASSLGIFIAAICKTEQQVSGLSTLIILGMSALGGSMFPSFLMPEYIQFVGKFTLNYWAMKGFTDIFWRNLHLSDIWLSITVLGGISLFFSTIAINIFRKRISEFY